MCIFYKHEISLYLIHQSNTDNAQGYGGVGFYAPFERHMYLTPTAFGYSPSQQIFTLIHELTHVQQHQQLGLLRFKDSNESDIFNQEQQADLQAIQAINCPICIQLIEDEWPQDSARRAAEGYLNKSQI